MDKTNSSLEDNSEKLISEIIEKCSKHMNFNEIIYEEIKNEPYCILGNIALYLSGEIASDNENIYADFSEEKKLNSLKIIYEIFDKYIFDDKIANLFIIGFFEGLNIPERNIVKKIAKNKIKDIIVYFYINNIIYEYWPRTIKNMPKKLEIFNSNFNPIDEIIKIRNDKIKLENYLMKLSKGGLKINKKNIYNIMERIIKI
jgi:hypothetical protein